MKVAIVGCGGIGYYLAEGIARTLANLAGEESEMWFIDGDIIKTKNLDRQFFRGTQGMNKAEALAALTNERFGSDTLKIRSVPDFVNTESLGHHKGLWLQDGLALFACVDNHPSRAFLEEHASHLPNCTVIMGGNDESQGQAQLYIRRGKRDVTPKVSEFAPEILYEEGELPTKDHCLEEAVSEPQTAEVNRAVALAMELLFRDMAKGGKPEANEIRVDIAKGFMGKFQRKAIVTKEK
jgi:molybdopterin/thiamine biosynthesis adenylyltransferase